MRLCMFMQIKMPLSQLLFPTKYLQQSINLNSLYIILTLPADVIWCRAPNISPKLRAILAFSLNPLFVSQWFKCWSLGKNRNWSSWSVLFQVLWLSPILSEFQVISVTNFRHLKSLWIFNRIMQGRHEDHNMNHTLAHLLPKWSWIKRRCKTSKAAL